MSVSIPYGELEQKYEDAKAAIERVRVLLAELESTADMVSPYLVAYQIGKALEGTDEHAE